MTNTTSLVSDAGDRPQVDRCVADAFVPMHRAKSLCRMVMEHLWRDAQSADGNHGERALDALHAVECVGSSIDEAFQVLEELEKRELASLSCDAAAAQ